MFLGRHSREMFHAVKAIATKFSLMIIFVMAVDLTFRKYILLSPGINFYISID